MAIIYSYPTVEPTRTDLILGTDVSVKGKPTKNFTVQSIIDLVTVATGDLQTVLDLGFVAVGRDINLTNNTFKGAGFQTQDTQTPANVLVNITGQVGTGFTDFTSTRITGTLQTPSQPNVTSLGTLTELKIGNATPAVTSIETTFTNPGTDLALATTKAIVDYIATTPNPDTLFQTLQAGNTAYSGGVGFDIDMGVTGTSNGNILFGNNKKIKIGDFGVTYPLEMFYGGDPGPSTNVVAILQNKAGGVSGNVPLTLRSDILDLSSVGSVNPSVSPEKYLTATKDNGVLLYFNDDKKFETLTGGAKTTGTFEATGSGTFVNLLNSGTYQDSSGDVGTAGQILSSTATGTNWITDPNPTPYLWKIEADSGTGSPYTVANGDQIHFVGVGNVNTEWNNTNKELQISLAGTSVSGSGVDGRATYWTGNQTIGSSDKYLFGSTNSMLSVHDTSDVHKGIIWADNFTTDGSSYPISATAPKWTGSVMTNMTAITSTLFTGDLAGNASTATQLATAGTITTTGDVSLTGGPYNYTQGGDMELATTIADSVIMGKLLDSYSAGTAGEIAASDTILQAFTKLQASITATTGLSYEGAWTPGTDATAGGTPDLRLSGAKVNGAFYICDADGTGTPNGNGTTPNSWKTGDWVIYVANGSATDEWQKLDQSNEVLGSGSPNQYTMWSGTNTIGTGVISQDTATTKTVTIGNSANLVVEGSTTLGDANTDTTTFKGPGTFEQTARLKTGLALGTATDGTEYGTAGYALTSGGASGNANTWTALEVGTVTSVGLTETGDALTITGSPITTSGTINIAGAGAPGQYINGELNLVTFPVVDNYVSWTLAGDSGATQTISSLNTATIAGGAGVNTQTGTKSVAINLAYTNIANTNFVDQATAGTPSSGDQLLFSTSGDVKRASIADIVDLGNETLAQVLSNGNPTGGTDIAVSAGDDITFTDTSKALFGDSNDLQIYHDGSNSYIKNLTGWLNIPLSQNGISIANADFSETIARFLLNGAVELYYDSSKKFETTSTGISVTGGGTFTGDITAAVGTFKAPGAAASIINAFQADNGNNAATFRTTTSGYVFEIRSQNSGTIKIDTSLATFTGNVKIDGNLTVDGTINHGGGGGGTAKGGTFTKLFTSVAGGSIAFLINRDTTGTMVFDVMMTSDTSTTCSIAKKFTVVKQFGVAPVVYKILDTGPDLTVDFTPVFAQHTNNTNLKCTITPNNLDTQKIGITIDLGFGQNDAQVVMN